MTATILVVENDRLIRDLVSKSLHRDGHQVLEACDGAIATMRSGDYRFCDAKTGRIKFIEQVHSFQPGIPIILKEQVVQPRSQARQNWTQWQRFSRNLLSLMLYVNSSAPARFNSSYNNN